MWRRWPRIPPLENRYRDAWRHLRRNCRRRKLTLRLSKRTFRALIDANCIYCGKFPGNRIKYDYIVLLYQGIDRLDNTKGYVEGNVAPCCYRCNSIKGNNLSHEEMILVAQTLKRLTRAAALLRSARELLVHGGSRSSTRKGARAKASGP